MLANQLARELRVLAALQMECLGPHSWLTGRPSYVSETYNNREFIGTQFQILLCDITAFFTIVLLFSAMKQKFQKLQTLFPFLCEHTRPVAEY